MTALVVWNSEEWPWQFAFYTPPAPVSASQCVFQHHLPLYIMQVFESLQTNYWISHLCRAIYLYVPLNFLMQLFTEKLVCRRYWIAGHGSRQHFHIAKIMRRYVIHSSKLLLFATVTNVTYLFCWHRSENEQIWFTGETLIFSSVKTVHLQKISRVNKNWPFVMQPMVVVLLVL